jgi:hypothetical protein
MQKLIIWEMNKAQLTPKALAVSAIMPPDSPAAAAATMV